jgi:hypothetical protein
MTAPTEYWGPSEVPVPYGYLDVTSILDHGRHGIPGMHHPYYMTRSAIIIVLLRNKIHNKELADQIMEAL